MLSSIAECSDRIKPTCNEITLPTGSPTLPTVVTTEKMQNQKASLFQSILYHDIILKLYPLKSPDDTHWWPTVSSAAAAMDVGVSWTR